MLGVNGWGGWGGALMDDNHNGVLRLDAPVFLTTRSFLMLTLAMPEANIKDSV